MKKKIEFTCPTCGNDKIEEVYDSVIEMHKLLPIVLIDDEGFNFMVDPDTQHVEGGELRYYRCDNCDLVLGRTEKEFMKFIKNAPPDLKRKHPGIDWDD